VLLISLQVDSGEDGEVLSDSDGEISSTDEEEGAIKVSFIV